ncbi:MAG: ABC transporter permease, partial [Agathobacter sp.]|uniref:ABC transporter permease n=1 Tax=Agathobacter sp. TaxID=2021311 RepID=UPI002E799888
MNKIYSRLAFTNIKNNKTLYMPYIISGMVMIAMFYVMMFLNNSKGLSQVPGADALGVIMGLGCGIIAVFSYIFLFYTNSFIIKRRKKEVGIYNILGMEKRHIARVLSIETLTVALTAIASGIIAGILFSKLMIMFLYRIINIKAQINFTVSTSAVVNTILIFGVLYFLTLIYNLMQVKLANPIELLRGGNVGEKEPKSKWFIAIIGLLCLAGGYYIAITTKNPLQVLSLFFVAVLLVIIGTYFLFISGSIVILKALRKNKGFYYNKKHFAAVSGMIYRMKQNAGGLASICVLSTMVLVVVSTTVSMYAGTEGELKQRYPADISVYSWYKEIPAELNLDDALKEAEAESDKIIDGSGCDVKESKGYTYFIWTVYRDGAEFKPVLNYNNDISLLYFVTRDE